MTKISVISPVHNEEDVIEELISRTTNVMKKHYKNDWEYIIVDDMSTDNTQKIVVSLLRGNSNLRYIRLKKRSGQTGCFKTGFNRSKGDFIITIDGDLQLLPEDIPLFVEKMNSGYDIVNGIREHRRHKLTLRLASRIFNLSMLFFFNCPVLDAASNFTGFKAGLVKNLNLVDNDHRYIIPIALRRGAKQIGEVVVRHRDRKSGKTKYRTYTKFIKGGPEIIMAWWRVRSGKYDKK